MVGALIKVVLRGLIRDPANLADGGWAGMLSCVLV